MSEMMTESALRWAKRNRAATRDEVVAMASECLRLRARVAELEAERVLYVPGAAGEDAQGGDRG